MDKSQIDEFAGYGIAIVGIANRVPGAKSPEEFWHNLENGIESVNFYSDQEMLDAGVTPDLLKNPQYVKAGAHLDKFDYFDPDFFGFSPKEAGILDPQHRQFYACGGVQCGVSVLQPLHGEILFGFLARRAAHFHCTCCW